ncbi:TonB-dependent receptor [Marinoscillum sp. MHG1-6]|uniref:SusC/RagA family TonB-linked outer membrane protein n=1 Tax=Marinoscillum sp. MHG1-6 TaxID=2959627 RepID=UPI002158343D|nr:TonB-dependent receptor [Marinoscillum sp. MHG1-6]
MSKIAIYAITVVYGLSLAFASESNAQRRYLDQIDIDISKRHVDLIDLIEEIEQKTGFSFAYYADDLNEIDIKVSNGDWKLDQLLREISVQGRLSLRRVNETITIKKVGDLIELPIVTDVIQTESIKGRITDEEGEPLPGATLLVKGSSLGTITDLDGYYLLELSKDDFPLTLVASFVGYQPTERYLEQAPVGNQVDFDLGVDLSALDEVVVVGYGTQKKTDLTGSVSRLGGDVVEDLPLTSADQLLQGRMAGVQVVNSGAPGGYVAVRVRGVGTINSADPLYVVDGFPVNGGISAINPDDIASIDVLKDASAAAIYGSRGANGVVIITTKRGKAGTTTVDLNTYAGFQEVTNPVQMLNASQYAVLNNEMRINGGETLNPDFSDPLNVVDSADWMNEVFKRGMVQNYNLSIRGGTEKLRYNISGGYFKQEGIIIGTGFDRKSFRLNLDSDAKEWLTVGNSFTYSLSNFTNNGGSGLVRDAMNSLPTQPVKRNGIFSGPEGAAEFDGDVTNPVGIVSIRDFTDLKHRMIDNLYVAAKPIKGLTLRSEFGLDLSFERKREWSPAYQWGVKEQMQSFLYEDSRERVDWLWDNTITYENTFGDHNFKVLAGISSQHSDYRYFGGSGQDFVSDVANQLDNILDQDNVYGSTTEWALLSYLGRINYDYKGRYLLTASARYDGSSRFGSNYRYGFFPSASAAWRLSSEPFMAGVSFIDDLKIRAGYGVTGNQNIGDFGYIARINTSGRYTFGNTTYAAVYPDNMPNPDMRWEQVEQTSLGIDMIVAKGLIGATVEVYLRDTEDMLLSTPIPITTGYYDAGWPILNVGAMRNKGIEFSINLQKTFNEFSWTSDLNGSINKNEILRLGGSNGDNEIVTGGLTFNKQAARHAKGHPANAFYGYVTDGIFQTDEEVAAHATQVDGTNSTNSTSPGDIRFVNLYEGDSLFAINDEDRKFLGNPNPDLYYGWSNTVKYKGFDLTVFLQGVYGNEVFNANRLFSEAMVVAQNQTVNTLNRWRGAGTSNEVPRATSTDPNNNQRVSDRYIEDGSYLRIKNLTLGYTLPKSVLEAMKIQKLRAYISIQNLATFTKYTGFDPEVDINGIDNSVYPQSRIVTAGLNITL